MKLSTKIIIGITATVALASATSIYLQNAKRKRNKRMLHVVSNEGYETAGDILFPKREGPDKGLHYGPVLPN
ncbi:MAG TPA: hypothetical protein VEX63_03540 [Flavisolibacter sp.]|jgi:hypothetical protein|nr:hypothetical protein [Flavisolibacter sp.]